jgi:hypothetical protein
MQEKYIMKKSTPKKVTLTMVQTFKTEMEKTTASQKIDYDNLMKNANVYPQTLPDLQQKLDALQEAIAKNAAPDYAAAKKEILEISTLLSPIQSSITALNKVLNAMSEKTIPNWQKKIDKFEAQITLTPDIASDFKEPIDNIKAYMRQILEYLSQSKAFLERIMPMLKKCTGPIEVLEQHISTAQAVEKADNALEGFIKSLAGLNKLSSEQLKYAPEAKGKALQFSQKLEKAKQSLPAWTVPTEETKGATYVPSTSSVT